MVKFMTVKYAAQLLAINEYTRSPLNINICFLSEEYTRFFENAEGGVDGDAALQHGEICTMVGKNIHVCRRWHLCILA